MNVFLQEETNRLEAPKQATLEDQFIISFLSRSDLFESKWQGQREGGSMICDNNTATGPSPSDASAIDLLARPHNGPLLDLQRLPHALCLLVQGRNIEGS